MNMSAVVVAECDENLMFTSFSTDFPTHTVDCSHCPRCGLVTVVISHSVFGVENLKVLEKQKKSKTNMI